MMEDRHRDVLYRLKMAELHNQTLELRIARLDETVDSLKQQLDQLTPQQRKRARRPCASPLKIPRLDASALAERSDSTSDAADSLLSLDSSSSSNESDVSEYIDMTPAEHKEYVDLERRVLQSDGTWEVEQVQGLFAHYIVSLLCGHTDKTYKSRYGDDLTALTSAVSEIETLAVAEFEDRHVELRYHRDAAPGIWKQAFPEGHYVPLKYLPKFIACIPPRKLISVGKRMVHLAQKLIQ